MTDHWRPFIVGIGGTPRDRSSTESALVAALAAAERAGAQTQLFGGAFLVGLPHFDPHAEAAPAQLTLANAVRRADGIILSSPSYHGAVSGLLKNALDTLEILSKASRPYFDGRPVGCVVTTAGRQAAGTTLTTMRAIVHAMRGWPTPFAAALDASRPLFDASGRLEAATDARQIETVARQVVDFAFSSSRKDHTVAY